MNNLQNVNNVFSKRKNSINFLTNLNQSRNINNKRVLLFGSSVNPPTGNGGHRGICEYFANLRQFDEIWILPVYIHSFENKSALEFHYRMNLCKLNFEDLSNESCRVIVQDFEKTYAIQNSGKLYTAGMLKKLRENYPTFDFHWFMGWDTFIDLLSFNKKNGSIVMKNGKPTTKWGTPEYILSTTPLHVVTREGVLTDWKETDLYKEIARINPRTYLKEEFILKKIYPHQIESLSDVSSTKIRNALKVIGDSAESNSELIQKLIKKNINFNQNGNKSPKRTKTISEECERAFNYLNNPIILNKNVLTEILTTPDILSYYQGSIKPLPPPFKQSIENYGDSNPYISDTETDIYKQQITIKNITKYTFTPQEYIRFLEWY